MKHGKGKPASFILDNSLLLLGGTVVAVVWANVDWRTYDPVAHPLHFWVNDVGMVFSSRSPPRRSTRRHCLEVPSRRRAERCLHWRPQLVGILAVMALWPFGVPAWAVVGLLVVVLLISIRLTSERMRLERRLIRSIWQGVTGR